MLVNQWLNASKEEELPPRSFRRRASTFVTFRRWVLVAVVASGVLVGACARPRLLLHIDEGPRSKGPLNLKKVGSERNFLHYQIGC